MTKPIIRIHNTETNEIIDREMTDNEFVKFEQRLLINENEAAEAEAKAQARAELLERLGITADEAKLLLA
jgi:hypothetical protein